MKKGKKLHSADILFPLTFTLLFCLCALLVVLQGARIYEGTAEGLQENYTVRTAVSYLKEKIKECGDVSRTEIGAIDGRPVLILGDVKQEERYNTYIYLEDGKLKELYTKEDSFTGLQGGQELVSLDSFSVSLEEENLIKICVSAGGREETAFIRLSANAG